MINSELHFGHFIPHQHFSTMSIVVNSASCLDLDSLWQLSPLLTPTAVISSLQLHCFLQKFQKLVSTLLSLLLVSPQRSFLLIVSAFSLICGKSCPPPCSHAVKLGQILQRNYEGHWISTANCQTGYSLADKPGDRCRMLSNKPSVQAVANCLNSFLQWELNVVIFHQRCSVFWDDRRSL